MGVYIEDLEKALEELREKTRSSGDNAYKAPIGDL